MISDLFRWLVLTLVIAVSVGGIYYQYQNTRPCVRPVTYAIGAVDSRFNTTPTTLITDAEAAATIWNSAAGKTVLVYDREAKLKINLIYDEREATAKMGAEIAQQQERMENARTFLDSQQARYTSAQNAYNQEVSVINARGGATHSERTKLAQERDTLSALESSLQNAIANYNASVASLNAKVAYYNQSTGKTFEQGQYVRDSAGERINIFEFIGTTQLRRVLTHEFGHAIGLDHNDDPKAIMFAKNESGSLVPTPADLSSLKALCGA